MLSAGGLRNRDDWIDFASLWPLRSTVPVACFALLGCLSPLATAQTVGAAIRISSSEFLLVHSRCE